MNKVCSLLTFKNKKTDLWSVSSFSIISIMLILLRDVQVSTLS